MFGVDDIIGQGLGVVNTLIDRLVPDKNLAEKMKADAARMQQEGELEEFRGNLQLALAQIQTNSEEAKSSSLFVSGWRPFIGWVSGVALALVYIPKALVITSMWTYQAVIILAAWNGNAPTPTFPVFPDVGVADVLGLLGSMLGLGALRTAEKFKGVARDTGIVGSLTKFYPTSADAKPKQEFF